MKYTLITLAALSSVASAQTYATGDYVNFANLNDFLSGANGTVAQQDSADSWFRDYLDFSNSDGQYTAFNNSTRQVYIHGSGMVGTASWLDGSNVTDFAHNQQTGAYSIRFGSAHTGFAAGDYVNFANLDDFLSGANGTVAQQGSADSWFRDYLDRSPGTGGQYTAFNNSTRQVYVQGSGIVGTASWLDGINVTDFAFNQQTGCSESLHRAFILFPVYVEARPVPSGRAFVAAASCGRLNPHDLRPHATHSICGWKPQLLGILRHRK